MMSFINKQVILFPPMAGKERAKLSGHVETYSLS